jgi:hypothetical protein
MPRVLRMICLLVVCVLILDCFSSHSPYPSQWPKIRESSDNECNNISGKYSDSDTENLFDLRRHSLANLLLKLKDDTKYDAQTSYIDIVQSDKIVEVKLKQYNQETIREKTLIIGKDIVCTKGGLHVSESALLATPKYAAIDYVQADYNLLMSEDGSLIVHATSGGFGCAAIIPIAGSESKYHRFERWRY